MKIAITGASGLIGSFLVPFLERRDHEITAMVRSKKRVTNGEVYWNYLEDEIDATRLEGHDAIIHLAGDNISEGRWTTKKKESIRNSRVEATEFLVGAILKLEQPPRVLISSSAVGFYGDRGDEVLDEESGPGTGFLATVCRGWEDATRPAKEAGIRVVNVRTAPVLTAAGGVLKKMLMPFKMGMGGKVGDGRQYLAWISMDDALNAIHHVLMNDTIDGPVNVAAPGSVTNEEFTKALGGALGRPTFMPMPEFAARAAFGEMADEMLLASQRVEPKALLSSGYEFEYPELGEALQHLLD